MAGHSGGEVNIRQIVRWNRLGFALARAWSALRKDKQMAADDKTYSVALTIWKGAKDLGLNILAVAGAAAGTAVLNWVTDNNAAVAEILGRQFSAQTTIVLAMALKAIGEMIRNAVKHK